MQELKDKEQHTRRRWLKFSWVSRSAIIILLMILAGTVVLGAGFTFVRRYYTSSSSSLNKTVATNGANIWNGDTTVTAPTLDFSQPGSQTLSISPLFAQYYQRHSGSTSLGVPVTVAFPSEAGWVQFFMWGALVLPAAQQEHLNNAEDSLTSLTGAGIKDQDTGIIHLPLIQALLTAGSQIPVAGKGTSLTYVDLRKATNPSLLLAAPTKSSGSGLSSSGNLAAFVKGGTRGGKDVGHLIPQEVWDYIRRPDISPDGWETDFGPPLTEALPFSVTENGVVHRMLVQAFLRDGVILDQDNLDTSGQPEIQRLDTSVAYLSTIGFPVVAVNAQQTTWVQGDTALLAAPKTGSAVAHVGLNFPLSLLGDTAWEAGMLWYHVNWTAPKRTGTGWVPASGITFTSPGPAAGHASIDALTPSLATYLAGFGSNVGVAIYDATRQRYYTYNASTQFIMGSSIKVSIMLTFLNLVEQQGREPNANELGLLTTMIENSNNDSAGILYHGEVGDAPGVASYLRKIKITGLDPYPGAFGWSLVAPMTMVNLLTLLQSGKILTAHDRALALSLMENIESDQQVGVGDTAPPGATAAMKDGWVIAPDNFWAMNTSGIVAQGKETYIISVYTRDQDSLPDEQAITERVCSTIASLLL